MNIWQRNPKLTIPLFNPLWLFRMYIYWPIFRLISDLKEVYGWGKQVRFFCTEDFDTVMVPVKDVTGWEPNSIALFLLSQCADFSYELEKLAEMPDGGKERFDWISKFPNYKKSLRKEIRNINFEDNYYLKGRYPIYCWVMDTVI